MIRRERTPTAAFPSYHVLTP